MHNMASVLLSNELNKEIEKLVKLGIYTSRGELLRDGARHIIAENRVMT